MESNRVKIKKEIEDACAPAFVKIALPGNSLPCVKIGDNVLKGEPVAQDDEGFCTAASISGSVEEISDGFIKISSSAQIHPPFKLPPEEVSVLNLTFDDIILRLKQAGIVGAMSGIPVYKKLLRAKANARRVIINCLESDPYSSHIVKLTEDYAKEIISGAKIIMHALCVKKSVVAVEKNKLHAIHSLKEAAGSGDLVTLALFKPKYPAGNELLTINAIYKKEIRRNKTPEESGFAVFSAETLYNVFNAFAYGTVPTDKIITVTGDATADKKLLRVQNGTPTDKIFADCDGLTDPDATIISGGIMRGKIISLSDFSDMSTNVLTAVSGKPYERTGECIRCGRCAAVCPMHLSPLKILALCKEGRYDECKNRGVEVCIECGCCSYVCPAGVDILRFIDKAKKGIESDEEIPPVENEEKEQSDIPSPEEENGDYIDDDVKVFNIKLSPPDEDLKNEEEKCEEEENE